MDSDNTLSFMFGILVGVVIFALAYYISSNPIERYRDTLLNCSQVDIRAMEDPDVDGRLVFYCESNKVEIEE